MPDKRSASLGCLAAALAIAGCAGKAATPCTGNFVLDPVNANDGTLLSPASGATAVPTSQGTLVFSGLGGSYSIVLKSNGGTGQTVQTTPTALPSPYAGMSGDFAVTIPTLQAGTTYAAGTLSDDNQCFGDYRFYQFGTFTTQ